MTYEIYRVNTFVSKVCKGNPACVIALKKWLSDEKLLQIAKENGVPETAFFIDYGNDFHLRWFTPDLEIDLCGHATLATAHVLKSIFNHSSDTIKFKTFSGELIVSCKNDFYYLNFPSRKGRLASLPKEIELALNIQPKEVFKARDYMLVYENEKQINELKINRVFFDQINLGHGGVVVTAKGDIADFVSRFFTPQATILEDPVTGSSHCTLIPFWSSRLCKKYLEAFQLSQRGGYLICEDRLDRVIIAGQASIEL